MDPSLDNKKSARSPYSQIIFSLEFPETHSLLLGLGNCPVFGRMHLCINIDIEFGMDTQHCVSSASCDGHTSD